MTDAVGATPMVSNAPSRGHSCTMSVSAADRNAPATRAAAAVLEVASAAMSLPPGRRQGTSAANQRLASSSWRPPTFSTTSAGRTLRPSGSSAAASATSSARFCLCARRRARTAIGRASVSTSTSARPAVATAAPSHGGPITTTGARPSVQRSTRRQRRRTAERAR